MRTLLFIVGGIVLWAIFTGVTKLFSSQAGSNWMPTIAFAVIWFAIAGWNMWVGVTQAGYSFLVELPIFLLIYLVPVALAAFVKYKALI
ncbi:MAG: hypothetical protein V2J55_04185 [Candidatus Competibacteraceae bacterium]|jgi:hypothetical protein|nr:hypothetical protein [Candidatus Competibacteraceae bacterium]